MQSFSSDNSPKHTVGIQKPGMCEGRDNRNCVFTDKCVKNQNGVWFCPHNKGRNGIRPPNNFENMTHSNTR
jgi:hypothetical protein